MAFRVGQKVVCINDNMRRPGSKRWPGANYVTKGSVYTIRGMFDDPVYGHTCLRLDEVRNDHLDRSFEPGFCAEHFRPVAERKTDISIFKEMLVPQRELSLTTGNRE